MRLWGEEKRLERRRRAICSIPKSHLLQHHHVFLKCAQDGLQGSLRSCGPTWCKALSHQVSRHHYGCSKVLSQQGCTGLPLFSHSLRGQNFLRPDGGALESEEMGPFSMKLLLFSHLWHFYSWNPRLCDYLKSDHICVMETNNQVFYSCWLGEDSNGNGTEWLFILEVLSF